MKAWLGAGCAGLLLTGCAAGTASAPVVPSRPNYGSITPGLQGVIGQTARAVTAMLGMPNADVQEGAGRKLQFASRICVLDAYLYRPSEGRGDPVVTHIDTRQRDGSPIDRASCVAALMRRDGGK